VFVFRIDDEPLESRKTWIYSHYEGVAGSSRLRAR